MVGYRKVLDSIWRPRLRALPYRSDPAWALKGARLKRKDFPRIDPFRVQDAEELIAAIHRDWGAAQGNFHEFRLCTGLRPFEEIALTVRDFDAARETLASEPGTPRAALPSSLCARHSSVRWKQKAPSGAFCF
jgi:integrase